MYRPWVSTSVKRTIGSRNVPPLERRIPEAEYEQPQHPNVGDDRPAQCNSRLSTQNSSQHKAGEAGERVAPNRSVNPSKSVDGISNRLQTESTTATVGMYIVFM